MTVRPGTLDVLFTDAETENYKDVELFPAVLTPPKKTSRQPGADARAGPPGPLDQMDAALAGLREHEARMAQWSKRARLATRRAPQGQRRRQAQVPQTDGDHDVRSGPSDSDCDAGSAVEGEGDHEESIGSHDSDAASELDVSSGARLGC